MAGEPKKLHQVFSKAGVTDREIADHIASPEFSKENYVDLLSGNYHPTGSGREYPNLMNLLLGKDRETALNDLAQGYISQGASSEEAHRSTKLSAPADGVLVDHPLNNPENNSKVIQAFQDNDKEWAKLGDRYTDYNEEARKNLRDRYSSREALAPILRNGKLKKEDLARYFGSDHRDLSQATLENRHLDQDTFDYLMGQADPSDVTVDHVGHPMFTQEHADKIFSSGKAPSAHVTYALANKGLLRPEHARMVLNSRGLSDADKALAVLPEEERKSILDKKLGIEGGSVADEDKESWQNWDHGKDHDPEGPWASSQFITDDQAEHVKRHGSFEEKKKLFENPSVDSRHGSEMWDKWDNDEVDHGYSFSDLKDDYKQTMDDGGLISEKFGDEGRRRAEEEYPIEDYINNNYDSGRVYDDSDLEDHITSNPDKFDTVHDNPDFDHKNPEHPQDNPRHIDFADQNSGGGHSYNLSDHPDYDDMLNEAESQVRKEKGLPDSVYDGYNEAISDNEYSHAYQAFEDTLDSFHKDWSNLPSHLKGKIPALVEARRKDRIDETKSTIKSHDLAGPYSGPGEEEKLWTREGLKNYFRPKINDSLLPITHDYGPGLHHAQMVKDYADANGGKIDLGTLVKRHPNLKDKFKQVLGDKQSISSQEVQQKIDSMPKTRYGVSMVSWGANQMQNINGNDQLVVRLDHSPESYKQFDNEPGLMDTFKNIQDASQRSGHPTNEDSIAWARVDTANPKHWMIDEVQSDFGSSLRRQIENAEHADPSVKAKLLDHLGKIEDAHKDWRENIINYVVNLAKKHGVEQISTHSPESKAAHTGAQNVHTVYKDSYQKVPRQMGFVPVDSSELPLTAQGKRTFARGTESKVKFTDQELEGRTSDQHIQKLHRDAMEHHLRQAKIHSQLSSMPSQGSLFEEDQKPEVPEGFQAGSAEHHADMFQRHKAAFSEHKRKAMQHDPTNFYAKNVKFDEYGSKDVGGEDFDAASGKEAPAAHPGDKLLSESLASKPHPGHTLDLKPASLKLKKSEIEAIGEAFAIKLMDIL